MYETLLTNEECSVAVDMGDFYRVPCDKRGLNYDKYFNLGDTQRNPLVEFDSRLGWEATGGYICDARRLHWKLRQVRYIIDCEIATLRKQAAH